MTSNDTGFRDSLSSSSLLLTSPAHIVRAGLITCVDACGSKSSSVPEKYRPKALLNIDSDEDLERFMEGTSTTASSSSTPPASIHQPDDLPTPLSCELGPIAGAMVYGVYWLCFVATHLAGAVLILFLCYLLNSRIDGFQLVDGHLLVKNAAFPLCLIFWIFWCGFSCLMGSIMFLCCEEWPAVLGDGTFPGLGVVWLWLLVPCVSIFYCLSIGSAHAALCFAFGLLPVALLVVFLRVMLPWRKPDRKRVRSPHIAEQADWNRRCDSYEDASLSRRDQAGARISLMSGAVTGMN